MRRVLAIDGGGVRGVLPASFLATIEEQIDGNVVDYFDLIVGTSTGGIIALALGAGISASDIRDFYLERGPRIFPSRNRLLRKARQLATAKYDEKQLKSELELEREEKTVIVEHFDRRLATIEEAAEAAANRVAAAERELIKGSKRPWLDGGDRVGRADRVRNGGPLEALEASIGNDKPRRDGPARELDRPRGDAREPSRAG